MFYEVDKGHGLPHDPFKALVVPRPIGWISTVSARGQTNLAPYSFFNAVSDNPHMVAFASDGLKDTLTFVQETREFVCSVATWETREAMNATSATLPRGENEFTHAQLTSEPSRLVRPPRVAESPAALECRLLKVIELEPLQGIATFHLVVGQVVGIHIDDRFIVGGKLDTAAMRPISRAGYRDFFVCTDETRFEIVRPDDQV